MGKIDRKRNAIVSKRYKSAQKNKRVCLILPGKNKKAFTYEVMLELMAGRKDEEVFPAVRTVLQRYRALNGTVCQETSGTLVRGEHREAGELGWGQILFCLALHWRK